MPATSRAERLARLERILLSADRYVDALLEVQTHTGELVGRVGGLWDCTAGCYVELADRKPVPRVFRLKKSQEKIGRAMFRYIAQRRARDESRSLVMFGVGDRGGGKTAALGGIFAVALALEFPGSWQASVNITTKQRREVLDAIDMVAPARWIKSNVEDFRDPRTELITGTTILWFSSKNPAALRQAGLGFEYVFINEAQNQSVKVFGNALFAVRKMGAIVGVATNGSQGEAGDWIPVLVQAIEAGEAPAAELHELPAADNDAIDQATKTKTADLLRIADQQAYNADALGLVSKLSGNLAYPGFSSLPRVRGGNVGEPPEVPRWRDVTRELTAEVAGEPFDHVAGADFQGTPGSCAPIGKLFIDERGLTVLAILDFVAVGGTEAALSQALVSRGYYPGLYDDKGRPTTGRRLLLVGDGTGARQNAEHHKHESNSFIQLRGDGWTVIPPMLHFRTRVPWNPLVRDSRAQMHVLFGRQQILISPRLNEAQPGRTEQEGFAAPIESLRRCKVTPAGAFIRKGGYTHFPDGVRYLAWRFLPRAQPPVINTTFDAETHAQLSRIRLFSE